MRLVFAVLVSLCIPAGSIYAALEAIPAFDAVITVRTDATIEVTERIRYDFGSEKKHGIFRTIPYSYQAGTETYTADISSVTVTDEKGAPLPFNESRGRGMLTLKIGDPETTITGEHLYVISYVVDGPFLYFDEYDELYWNVTGVWENSIATATALVNLPPGVQVFDASCYQGSQGDTNTCTQSEKLVNTERAGYVARAESIAHGEGFTVAVSFPKGVITERTQSWKQPMHPWQARLPFALPFIALGVLVCVWYVRGRDQKRMGTIVTQYEPPKGMTPSLAGIVYNELIEPREISAEIVRLAVEGFLRIHRIEKKGFLLTSADYLLERVPDSGEPQDTIGAHILERLFKSKFSATEDIVGHDAVSGTLLSKMQHKFVKEQDEIVDHMYSEVLDQGFFIERPDRVRMRYAGVGTALIVTGGVLAFFMLGDLLTNLGISIALSGVLVAIMAFGMPARTREGVSMKEHIEGFKRYLSVAEKDRLAFHNSPEHTPKLFDTYLPYAMALGVEKAWAEQFTDIYKKPPQWYTGNVNTFAPTVLASDLSAFSADFHSASTPQSSGSRGGGHAGGGFGGGGGGSW